MTAAKTPATSSATRAASHSKAKRRAQKKIEILRELCPEKCKCFANFRCLKDLGVLHSEVLLMSHSLKWISAELNDSGIKTVSRKGKWEPTTLKNIFREELPRALKCKNDHTYLKQLLREIEGG
jgi:hypothetical protein